MFVSLPIYSFFHSYNWYSDSWCWF